MIMMIAMMMTTSKVWPADAWKAAPVKSGSLVLIHGQVSYHDDDGVYDDDDDYDNDYIIARGLGPTKLCFDKCCRSKSHIIAL